MPLVSVIVPTYNRPDLLVNRCLPSVFAQTVQDQEVLVIGDGTDDETVRLMEAEPRVRFWNLPHYPYPATHADAWGLYGLASLNFGLDQATGEWIAVLADDDEWTPDHHEALLDGAHGAEHVYGQSDTYKDGRVTGQMYGWGEVGQVAFCNGANIYRRSLGYRYDLNCRSRGRNGDDDLWTRMREDGVKFRRINQIVHHYHRAYP